MAEGYNSRAAERLKSLWETAPGIYGWLATVDHKALGIRYIVTAFVFLALGGIEALIFRLQLAQPNEHLLTPEQYDQLFTMHGITMILWYAFPILTGFSVYLQPLLLGTRDMALPRLNAFTYWVFLFSGMFLYAGLFRRHGAGRRMVQLRSVFRGRFQYRTQYRLLRTRQYPTRHLDDARHRSTSSSRSCACARRECRSTGCRS